MAATSVDATFFVFGWNERRGQAMARRKEGEEMRPIVARGLAWGIALGAASGCSSTPVASDAGTADAAATDSATTDAARPADAAADGSSSGVCNAIVCSADPAPTDASKKACEEELKGPCGAGYGAVSNCVLPKVTCGPDNKADQASLNKALTDCARELKAYQDCKAKNVDAGP